MKSKMADRNEIKYELFSKKKGWRDFYFAYMTPILAQMASHPVFQISVAVKYKNKHIYYNYKINPCSSDPVEFILLLLLPE